MVTNLIKSGDYWGIGFNHDRDRLLVQLIEGLEITRVALTKEEAEQLLEKLKCTLDFIKD